MYLRLNRLRCGAFVVAAAGFFAVQAIGSTPVVVVRWFCLPAARLASAFLALPMMLTSEGYAVVHPALTASVGETCSGVTFIALLYAVLLLWHLPFRRLVRWPVWAVALLPVAYGVGLLSNAARVACSLYAGLFGAVFLSPTLARALHMGVGVVVFLSVLILVCLVSERSRSHA